MATLIRPNQEFTVKANVSRGDTRLVSWIIFQGHGSNEANILNIYPKHGLEMNHSFPNEGKFRFAAYNKEIQTKADFQNSPELKHVDIEVKFNQLHGTKLIPKNSNDFLAGDIFRKDFPAVFEAKFLINPPTHEEISRLQFELEDNSGNTLREGTKTSNTFTFIPRNSNAKYTIKAVYKNESDAVFTQSFSGTSKAVSVRDITHAAELVRPGTPMSFSVTRTQFGNVKNDGDLPEQENIKWNLNKVLIGTGRTITISGSQLLQKKKYHIEAYATSAIGKTSGSNTDSTKNDWHFEVKDNIVEKIKVIKKPKYGIEGEFEIEKMTFPNYDPAKDGAITWIVTGPESVRSSEIRFKKIFSTPGTYTISCKIGGRECTEPLTLEILQPEVIVDRCKWIDKDHKSGNIITEAGINQEVCAFVHGNGLDNESFTLTVYDDDSAGRTDVYSCTFTTDESHKTGFYMPFTITQDVIDKIKKEGFSDYGDLYFNIIRNGSDLPVKNGDKKLGEYLKVTLEPKIVDAYFCDANDTQKLFSSSLDGALYFKIYAINLVGRKVEITFITESDAYWTWDDEMKIKDWEGIKNKFEDEKIRDTKTGTFNEKGEVLVPVDLSKMGKPKNFIRLNAMVKIFPDENAEEKQEEKGFYMQHNNLAILYPGATLPAMAENKGAMIVGREGIQGGENNSGCICQEQYKELVWGGKVSCEFRKKVVQISKNLGLPQENYEGANWLMTIMALESAYSFSPKCGTFGKNPDETSKYKYVGLIQFGKAAAEEVGTTRTHLMSLTAEEQLDFVEKHYKKKQFKNLLNNRTALYLAVNYPNSTSHASEKNYVVYDSDKDAYDDNPMFKRESDEFYIDKEGKKKYYEGRKGKSYVWEFEEALKEVEDLGKSSKTTNFTCGINNNDKINAKDIVTYRIYHDGKIEKHIPKTIKNGFEKKYKYVYHDSKNREHEICIADWHTTKEKGVGQVYRTKPTHSKVISDQNVSEGNTSRRVKYENGDIAEYGSHPKKGIIWLLYKAGKNDVELLRMPDSLSYKKDNVYISYSFTGTQRRYTGVNSFAGFIGYLAKSGFKLQTSGSCFSEGSSFPSQEHCNGRSVDTFYLKVIENDQKVIDSAIFFHFTEVLKGVDNYCQRLKRAGNGGTLHNSHLHSGNFDSSVINIIKEK